MSSLPVPPIEGHIICPLLGNLSLTTWSRWSLPDFSNIKVFFPLCNLSLMERYFTVSILSHSRNPWHMFTQCFVATTDDPCLNQLVPWWLQNTDSLMSVFPLWLTVVRRGPMHLLWSITMTDFYPLCTMDFLNLTYPLSLFFVCAQNAPDLHSRNCCSFFWHNPINFRTLPSFWYKIIQADNEFSLPITWNKSFLQRSLIASVENGTWQLRSGD